MAKKYFNVDLETSGEVKGSTVTSSGAIAGTTVAGTTVTGTTVAGTTVTGTTVTGTTVTGTTVTDGTATLSSGKLDASSIDLTGTQSSTAAGLLTASVIVETGGVTISGGVVNTANINSQSDTLGLRSTGDINIGLDTDGTGGSNKLTIYDNGLNPDSGNSNTVLELKSTTTMVTGNNFNELDLKGDLLCDSIGPAGENGILFLETSPDWRIRLAYGDFLVENPNAETVFKIDTMSSSADKISLLGIDVSEDIDPSNVLVGHKIESDKTITFTGDIEGGGIKLLSVSGGAALQQLGEDIDLIKFIDNNVYMPGIPVDDTSNTSSKYLGIDSNGKLWQADATLNLSFFTGAHIYPSKEILPIGSTVYLDSEGASLTTSANSSICVGIVVRSYEVTTQEACSLFEFTDENKPSHLVEVASVGDSRHKGCQGFNVCNENGDIQPGDLLVTSSTPGYLMKQDDDIIRSKTVGKAMEAVTFDDNGQATGVYGFIYCG
jgi:hypothetical protein